MKHRDSLTPKWEVLMELETDGFVVFGDTSATFNKTLKTIRSHNNAYHGDYIKLSFDYFYFIYDTDRLSSGEVKEHIENNFNTL